MGKIETQRIEVNEDPSSLECVCVCVCVCVAPLLQREQRRDERGCCQPGRPDRRSSVRGSFEAHRRSGVPRAGNHDESTSAELPFRIAQYFSLDAYRNCESSNSGGQALTWRPRGDEISKPVRAAVRLDARDFRGWRLSRPRTRRPTAALT
jgi:hypothetical protein